MNDIRPPAFAGSFYPEDPEELQKEISKYLKQASTKKTSGTTKALIVPHAGYEYSGPVAACGYKLLQKSKFEEVILIGPSHRMRFQNCGLNNFQSWKTPLGFVHLSKVNDQLATEASFSLLNETHTFEHSIEVQLPFLQSILKDFKILPIATGNIVNHRQIALTLKKYIKQNTLLIVSSDLSHYLPYKEANDVDNETIDQILNLDSTIDPNQACGAEGINILIELAKLLKWKVKLIDYRNSGDTEGSKKEVVGYSAIEFYK